MFKKSLLIATVGHPKVGKTTVLCMLAELLYEDEIPTAGFYCDWPKLSDLWLNPIGNSTPTYSAEHKIILTDNVQEDDVPKIQSVGGIIIRVRYNQYTDNVGRKSIVNPENILPWVESVDTDFHISSEDGLRRLSYEVRALYCDQIKNCKKWKTVCQ